MNNKKRFFLLFFVFICLTAFANEHVENTYCASYDRITDPKKEITVYIIKDIHCNYVMQKQIVDELKKIDRKKEIGFIAVEGSAGELSFDFLKSFPDHEILNSATDSFMKTADLLGVECFASKAVSQGRTISVVGLENIELYSKNKSCFLSAISNSDIIKPVAARAHSAAKENILNKMPPDKSGLLRILYNNDTEKLINLIDYLKTAGFNLNEFKSLNNYHALNIKLKKIPRNKLESESSGIDKFLKTAEYTDLYKEFNIVRKKYYAGIVSLDNFIHTINDIVKLNGLDIQTPVIDSYIAVSNEINRIDFYLLNEEIASIFNQIELSVVNNIVDNALIEKRAVFSLIEKLYDTSLKYTEYKSLTDYFNSDGSSGLAKKIYRFIFESGFLDIELPGEDRFVLLSKPYIDFYNLASKRDIVMADKFLSSLPPDIEKKSYVIVAGGFHTDGLSKVLTEKGINHKIVIPKVPKYAELDNKLYINKITGTDKKFDLALNEYVMGLQVWLNFSSSFPDEASRASAEMFRYKFISFLVSESPQESPAFKEWIAQVSEQQGIIVSAVARNREGVICSIANRNNPDRRFLFEISMDKTGAPVFSYNKYYETAIDALYVEPSNRKLDKVSRAVYSSVISEQALMPGTDDLNDLSRFMFMLRLNNPRVFYEISSRISGLLKNEYPENKINERARAVMRFNLALDEVEAANAFYENRLISLNEAGDFINLRRAIVETAYNIYGSNDNFSVILDTASKKAELSMSLLVTLGVLDRDWLIDHYLALFSWFVSQDSLVPEIYGLDFPTRIFNQLPALEFDEISLHQRIESGIEHIKNDKYGFNRALNFAQTAVERLSMPYKVFNSYSLQSPGELLKALRLIIEDYPSGSILSPLELDLFIEKILAEDVMFLQPLLRASGEYSIRLSPAYVNAVATNPDLFISTNKSPFTSYYILSSLFARQGNEKNAREFLNKYIEEINRLKKEPGFNEDTGLVDEIAHQITLIFSKPWVTNLQKYQMINIYDSFYSLSTEINESAPVDLKAVRFRNITVNDRVRNFVSEGRVSWIPANGFNLDVVSLDAGRMVDFSKFAYLPLPGYIQIDRPGKTIPEMAAEKTKTNPMVLLAAVNGSNADWSAPNAFLIKDGELIIKPVPGMNQKERVPLLGTYSVLAFDNQNRARLTRVKIEYDKLITDENIHYGIQGQVILENGKIYPSPPKPEVLGYAQGNEVGFNTVTKIRASFSAIGVTEDGSVVLITMIGKINIPAVANLLKRAGAKNAVLLGGSGDAQQVTLSAEPVLAEERWDKPLRAGTYPVRPVNMGLMFFSNSLTSEEVMRNFVKDVLKQRQNREILETSL